MSNLKLGFSPGSVITQGTPYIPLYVTYSHLFTWTLSDVEFADVYDTETGLVIGSEAGTGATLSGQFIIGKRRDDGEYRLISFDLTSTAGSAPIANFAVHYLQRVIKHVPAVYTDTPPFNTTLTLWNLEYTHQFFLKWYENTLIDEMDAMVTGTPIYFDPSNTYEYDLAFTKYRKIVEPGVGYCSLTNIETL